MTPETSRTVEIAFYVKGDALEPEQVSSQLGLEPLRAHRKDQVKVTSSGEQYSTKTGLWMFSIKSDSGDIEPMLFELLSKLGGVDKRMRISMCLSRKMRTRMAKELATFPLTINYCKRWMRSGSQLISR